jgi:hypothetical protein
MVLVQIQRWGVAPARLADVNPATKVERYKDGAPQIHFLSPWQVAQQLTAIPELSTSIHNYGDACRARFSNRGATTGFN